MVFKTANQAVFFFCFDHMKIEGPPGKPDAIYDCELSNFLETGNQGGRLNRGVMGNCISGIVQGNYPVVGNPSQRFEAG